MRLIYSVAGAALAHVAVFGYGKSSELTKSVEGKMRSRVLQDENMLCGTTGSVTPDSLEVGCLEASLALSVQNWQSCCNFGTEEKMCREYVVEGSYCDPTVQSCQDLLKADDTLELFLTFSPETQECCKKCICYGDPECISFSGAKDVWIPCDARDPKKCYVDKERCLATRDPNGVDFCTWNRSDRSDSKGWDFPMNGSPCLPDLSKEIKMNMYNFGSPSSSYFNLDLALGERGIIAKTVFTLDQETYTLDAQSCFDYSGEAAWVGGKAPAGALSASLTDSDTERSWAFFHESTKTFIKMFCVRAKSGSANGIPRINIQELTVDAAQEGQGFCATGTIGGRTGDWEESISLHKNCVQDKPDSMMACKHLVNFAFTYRELPLCAQQFCTYADVNTADCIKALGDGSNDSKWVDWYCKALKNNGQLGSISTGACVKQVNSAGYSDSIDIWGRGEPAANAPSCTDKISDYDLKYKSDCDDGLSIDVMIDGAWVEKYFIPSHKPPCTSPLTVSYLDAPLLFTSSIRIRQCSVRDKPQCAQSATCSGTTGAEFNLKFSNAKTTVLDMYNSGVLRCVPNAEGSDTWCLPKTGGSTVELCPCPNTDSRRVLLG